MNITYHEASSAMKASIEKAEELGVSVSIAVVDTGGHLMNLVRLDSVYGVLDFAIKKAKTAAMFGTDSDVMGTIIAGAGQHSYGMMNANEGLLTIAGGVILKDKEGKAIGAIGSSGGTPEQDKEIAMAGAAAIF